MEIEVLDARLGPGVRAGFTTRRGGRSRGAFSGLNLALHVGDDAGDVAANRSILAGWAGAPVRFAHQVHGRGVLLVEDAVDAPAPGTQPVPEPVPGLISGRVPELISGRVPEPVAADAVVTVTPGIAVGVLVADCVPVLLADVAAGVAAAVHAGRQGLVAGVLQAALAAMSDQGARPAGIRAAIGPAAGGCCYEVPHELRAQVSATHPQAWAQTSWGTPSLDLRAACEAALRAGGVATVHRVGGCTIEDDAFYSYRRATRSDLPTGRIAGVVRVVPAAHA